MSSALAPILVVVDFIGVPGEVRTPDLSFRKALLYPAELRGRTGREPLDSPPFVSVQAVFAAGAAETSSTSEVKRYTGFLAPATST